MKIGILTFHSQINYGGLLQCHALKSVLSDLGFEVVVVDRWLDARNSSFRGPFRTCTVKEIVRYLLQIFLLPGILRTFIRYLRTIRFVSRFWELTPYHFQVWKDAPLELGIDCLVVGSDQVWNCAYQDPSVYLLCDAPKVPAISYAASLGVENIPQNLKMKYCEALKKFSHVSVRESSAVALLKGVVAKSTSITRVVDPTLLATPDMWYGLVPKKEKKRRLVCYFLGMEVQSYIKILSDFARMAQVDVEVFVNPPESTITACARNFLPNWSNELSIIFNRRIKIMRAAGPIEFLRSFSSAEMVLTDSFHAMVFASIYKCNVRVLRPTSLSRRRMFSRIEEFVANYIRGDVIKDDIKVALKSFDGKEESSWVNEKMEVHRSDSRKWLIQALSSLN